MPQHVRITRVCRDCAGFASAMVTTGTRHLDGTRVTLRVTCPACKGVGTVAAVTTLTAPVGR
ncbi:hypothetical protein [Streptomyces sp. NPDC051677]|uniref:hypothetical protein n=1 Tax=Streptomyces sp. NPDC051677 TaxID=3365669 RepID=UPI0037D35C59